MNRKICIVSPHYPPKTTGISIFVHELSKTLVEEEFGVGLVTVSGAGQITSDQGKLHFRKTVKRNPEKAEKTYLHTFAPKILNDRSPLASFFLLSTPVVIEVVKNHRIDIVHVHTSLNYSTAAYLGARVGESLPEVSVILTIHGGGTKPKPVETETRRTLLNKIDRITVVSNILKKNLQDVGVPADKIVHIPNGIDVDRFSPDIDSSEIRQKYGIKQSDPLILYVGRLDPGKGVQYLIAAFIKLLKRKPRARLLLVGDGYLSGFIKEIVSDCRLERSVFAEGSVDQNLMPKVYSAADLMVFPSTKEEACPLVLLEAMASGKPVIACRVGGVPEVIDDGENGFLVYPSDDESLAKAMFSIIEHKNIAEALGMNARIKAEREYDIDKIAERYRQLYNTLLKQNPGNLL